LLIPTLFFSSSSHLTESLDHFSPEARLVFRRCIIRPQVYLSFRSSSQLPLYSTTLDFPCNLLVARRFIRLSTLHISHQQSLVTRRFFRLSTLQDTSKVDVPYSPFVSVLEARQNNHSTNQFSISLLGNLVFPRGFIRLSGLQYSS
jgi:hypothetical protein